MAHPVALSALLTTGRQNLSNAFQTDFTYTVHEALSRDNHYTLFRYEDWPAWVAFSATFAVLLAFDQLVLNGTTVKMTMARAIAYTLFWIGCACAFCGGVYWVYGEAAAFMWMSGYMLEWMLSFDNLFVFHMIFSVYATPDQLKHRPLYLGIWGAIVFRLAFIFVGEYLMHTLFFMHFIFGSFLIYTGLKTVAVDDDDDDPSKHPVVLWLQNHVPFVSAYDKNGAFFVRVPVDKCGNPELPAAVRDAEPLEAGEAETTRYSTVDFAQVAPQAGGKTQLRATMLMLVVICIEISDLLFAVDSVSAIVAQVNDLFLAYTSAVFAMLGLRATFFIIDVLAKVFSLLKYGVATVLVFIGVKLCISRWFHIPPGIVCMVLVSSIATSMVASVAQERVAQILAKAKVKSTNAEATEKSPLLKPAQ